MSDTGENETFCAVNVLLKREASNRKGQDYCVFMISKGSLVIVLVPVIVIHGKSYFFFVVRKAQEVYFNN